MKKIVSIIVSLCLISSLVTGCSTNDKKDNNSSGNKTTGTVKEKAPTDYMNLTGNPITKEKITLKMFGGKAPIQSEWDKMDFFIKREKETNIAFTFDTPPASGAAERKNIIMASGEYPDVIFGSDGNTIGLTVADEIRYGGQGILVPLENLIEKYAPNLKKLLAENPEIKKSITTMDGHIYALPYIEESPMPPAVWINSAWLQELGMSMPKNVEDLYAVVKAFKGKDLNKNGKQDEIPISAFKLNEIRILFLTAFGMADVTYVDNNKVIYSPYDSRYLEYLKYVRKLYAEELLDKETFTQTTQQIIAKGNNDQLGVFRQSAPFTYVKADKNTDYKALPPLTSSVNSKQVWPSTNGVKRGTFAITKSNKYPEASIRWVDQLYTEEAGHNAVFGSEGLGWKWLDAGKTKFTRITPEGKNPEEFRGSITPACGLDIPIFRSRTLSSKRDDPKMTYVDSEKSSAYSKVAATALPLVYFTEDEQKRKSILETDINTYVEQMESKFIMGIEPLDKWNDYINTLKKMGVEDLIKINQAAYDRWNRVK